MVVHEEAQLLVESADAGVGHALAVVFGDQAEQLAAQEPEILGALAGQERCVDAHADRVLDVGHRGVKLVHQKVQLEHLRVVVLNPFAFANPGQPGKHAVLRSRCSGCWGKSPGTPQASSDGRHS
ncbi:hypothetical protein D9M68_887160 [compost metagenome]